MDFLQRAVCIFPGTGHADSTEKLKIREICVIRAFFFLLFRKKLLTLRSERFLANILIFNNYGKLQGFRTREYPRDV